MNVMYGVDEVETRFHSTPTLAMAMILERFRSRHPTPARQQSIALPAQLIRMPLSIAWCHKYTHAPKKGFKTCAHSRQQRLASGRDRISSPVSVESILFSKKKVKCSCRKSNMFSESQQVSHAPKQFVGILNPIWRAGLKTTRELALWFSLRTCTHTRVSTKQLLCLGANR